MSPSGLGLRGHRKRAADWTERPRETSHKPAELLMKRPQFVFLAGFFLAATGPAHGQALFIVDNSVRDAGDWNPGDGICAYNSAPGNRCTLRAAVQEANALPGRDVILIPDGWTIVLDNTLFGAEDLAASGDLDILEDVGIGSLAPAGAWPVVDANGIDRVFDVHPPATLDVAQLEITGGRTVFRGGGVYVRPAAGFEASNCRIRDNKGSGGGIANEGTTDIETCSIEGNHALNSFDSPSGIYHLAGSTTIDKSTVTGNYNANAAIRCVSGTGLSVFNSTIADNLGILNNPSTGIGIESDGDVVLRNATITGHQSIGFSVSLLGAFASPSVRNTIIAGNGTDCSIVTPGGLTDLAHPNLDSDGSCGFVPAAGGLPNTDPLLGPLSLNGGTTLTRVPMVGSPAIDSGANGSCQPDDQRGAPRPLTGSTALVCDLGAVEVLPCTGAPTAYFSGWTITAQATFEACYQATLGSVDVLAGGDLTVRVRDSILFEDGLAVYSGATLRVVLDPAAGSGMTLP